MKKDSSYFLIGGFLSFIIYLSLLFFIFSFLGRFERKSKQYTSERNNFIEVSISQKQVITRKKSVKKRSIKKKIHKEKIPKKIKKSKSKIKKSIRKTTTQNSLESLFKTINTKKIIKKFKNKNLTKKIEPNQNSRLSQKNSSNTQNQKSASKIVKSLSLMNVSSNVSKKTGEYNKYLGKISDILDQKWQETPSTIAGNSAKVTVRIDKFGNFSYKIDSLSYNNEFNAKLQNFLESLKNEKFPPYKNGDYIEIQVNFKDE